MSSGTLRRLAEFLIKELPQIEAELSKFGLKEKGCRNLCELASRALQNRLKREGFTSQILAGDLVVGEKDCLEHYVNLVIAPEKWVVIDLTVDQVQKHSNDHLLIKVVDPNRDALKKVLQEEYNWWYAK